MKKQISTIQFAFSFAGCFLGAGYLSGRELWQYFGCYGAKGLIGIILSILLLGLISFFVMMITLREGFTTMAATVIGKRFPPVGAAVNIATQLLFLSVACIMIAGIGALGTQLLGLPTWTLSVLACLGVGFIAYFGLRGMISVFSASVPILIISALVVVALQLTRCGGFTAIRFEGGTLNPLLGSWFFSLVNYVGINIFGSVGVMAPVAQEIQKKSRIITGLLIGTFLLLFLGLSLLTALASAPESILAELPMMSIAQKLSPLAGWVYGILLFLGMFGNCTSSFVAILFYLETRSPRLKQYRLCSTGALTVVAFIASLVGFTDLMNVLYPVYGYFGILILLLIALRYFAGLGRKH